jgi:hypothetical protein
VLKFGVTDVAGLDRPRTPFGRPRDVAVPVLWRALQRDPERYGRVCAEAFNRLRMGNGVYKYTAPRRFDDVAADVLRLVDERLAKLPLRVHDLGVSDATTSVELFAALAPRRPDLRFVMSDWFDAVYVLKPDGGPWSAVLDAELRLIQFFGRGFVLTPQTPPRKWHPVNRLLLSRLRATFEPRVYDAARELRRDVDPPEPPAGWTAERVPLVCRAALELVRTDPRAAFERHSVLAPMRGSYSFVRAMNVLNRGYFGEDDLRAALAHVRDALEIGGLFLVGRNVDEEDGRTAATAYLRTERGFEVLRRFREGSEIAALVEGALPAPRGA